MKKQLATLLTFLVTLLISIGCETIAKFGDLATLRVPDAPSSLTLVLPYLSPGLDSSPTIEVNGVLSGDTVKVFIDSNCLNEVGSAVASGNSVNVTTSTLTANDYSFYANSTGSSGGTSSCSVASVNYKLAICPSGYIPIPANADVDAPNDFCVMKFEAKAWDIANNTVDIDGCAEGACSSTNWGAGTHRPESVPEGRPWVQNSQIRAKSDCRALGVDNYDLISNPEWMAIARNIEGNPLNWSGVTPVVGVGTLNRGHSDGSTGVLAVSDVSDPYNGTGNSAVSGRDQKRTHSLSNGEEIWDFAGNVFEWTDWTLGGPLETGPTGCGGFQEFKDIVEGCHLLMTANSYMPGNPGSVAPASYDSSYGLGQIYGTGGAAAVRGGYYGDPIKAGVFAIILADSPGDTRANIGFRCVYRPD